MSRKEMGTWTACINFSVNKEDQGITTNTTWRGNRCCLKPFKTFAVRTGCLCVLLYLFSLCLLNPQMDGIISMMFAVYINAHTAINHQDFRHDY